MYSDGLLKLPIFTIQKNFKILLTVYSLSPPFNTAYSHEQNSTYSVFMHVCEAWQLLLSLQIYSNNQLQMV